MEELTYNPVLDNQPVPRWRLMNPLRPPVPGRALVLVPDEGHALTILPGEEIPAARFGSYQSVYTVDISEHRLVLDIPLLSRDPSFSFRGRVDLVCRVDDPAEVVRRGIRDMSGALHGALRKMLREVSREYDIAEFHDAERALNASLRSFEGDSAVRLRSIQVELLVDEDEIATSGRAFRDVERETRLDGMRRRRHLDLMRDEGVEGIIAEIMEREGPRAALAWIEKGEAEQREANLQTLRMVLERGDGDREPFEQTELERAVIDGILGGGDRPLGGVRRGRLRGALSAGRDADDELPSSAPASSAERAAETRGSEAGPRRGRARPPLRGEVVMPVVTPPEDEPVPPSAGTGRPDSPTTPPPVRPEPPATAPAPERGTAASRPSRISGTSRTSRTSRPQDSRETGAPSSSPAPEQPARVSRVRGTAKRQNRDGGTPS
ncbi:MULTISPECIES: hypothetical protein [unclassified Streptomyces]|uniref:hypothetical protein n=1 Tax=unclassified Streptomyces TaxID=2593676 RepID=UPI00093F2DA0|nr:hypothetical protein [Streptomyces sp. TSRI0281]OKI46924.1 hypothetical protein A6A29_25610 [Streptomyces sp. TSRI0281]